MRLGDNGTVLTPASAVAMLSPVDNFRIWPGRGDPETSASRTLASSFMKNGEKSRLHPTGSPSIPNWGRGEGLVVTFTNYVAEPKVFASDLRVAAAKAMNWPSFPGLQDSGPPVSG